MDILLAILRKVIFIALFFGAYRIIDVKYFRAFDTDEIIKDNPIAVAILLGMFCIALALA